MELFKLLLDFIEKKSVKESPLKREVQAVKSILQGGSSSMRDHQQSHHHESQHSKDTHRHTNKDDKTKLKKRNLLEVFKKPSNAKEIGKTAKQRTSPHVIDKFELECIEILKVNESINIFHNYSLKSLLLISNHFTVAAFENPGQCKERTDLSNTNA